MSGIESAAQGLGHAVAFLFGAIVGSFLNVVVARVPAGESIVHPRSRCPACRTPIAWYDNVPVLSWLAPHGAVPHLPGRHLLPLPPGGAPRGRGRTGGGLPARALARRAGRVRVRGHAPRALLHRSRHLAAPPRHDRAAAPRRGRALGPGAHGGAHVPVVARRRGGRLALLRRRVPRGREGPQEGGARIRRRVAAGGDRRLGRPGRPPPGGAARLRAGHGDRARTHRDGTRAAGAGPGSRAVGHGAGGRSGARGAPPDPDADWVPPRNAVPFGPFLAAGALEWLWLQGWLAQVVPAMSIFR